MLRNRSLLLCITGFVLVLSWALPLAASSQAFAAGSPVYVHSYVRRDGIFVLPHFRSAPDGYFWNNWSTVGNINPYTGRPGTRLTPPNNSTLVESYLFLRPAGEDVFVNGYFRSNGSYVPPYFRSAPDGDFWNNWSTIGNVNPYTGEAGTRAEPSDVYSSPDLAPVVQPFDFPAGDDGGSGQIPTLFDDSTPVLDETPVIDDWESPSIDDPTEIDESLPPDLDGYGGDDPDWGGE